MIIPNNGIRAVIRFFDTSLIGRSVTVRTTVGSSFSTITKIPKNGEYNIGWESAEVSDSDGNIETWLELEFEETHTFVGVDFSLTNILSGYIEYYDINDNLIGGASGRNTYQAYGKNVKKIKILIYSIYEENETAKIDSILFGCNAYFGKDYLYDISASKFIDLAAEQSNDGDCSLTADKGSLFYALSVSEKLTDTIVKNQKITIFVSQDTEDDDVFGVYSSNEIKFDDGNRDIIISGNDILTQINESTFRKGIVYEEGRSLYDWAVEVAQDAEIEIVVDEKLKNIFSTGYISEVPHREALRLIAEAGNAAIFVNNDGVVEIKVIDLTSYGSSANLQDIAVEDTLAREDVDNVQGISVAKYSYFRQEYAAEIGYMESVRLTNEPQHIDIVYSQFPVDTTTVQVFVNGAGNPVITNKHVYAEHIEFDISGTPGAQSFITITGNPYDTVKTETSVGTINQNTKKIEDNFLIGDNIANDIAQYQYDRLVNKHNYSFESADETPFVLGGKMNFSIYDESVIVNGISFTKTFDEENVNVQAKSV